MENASKALIIAGAIILAILIIGLGMVVFNQARDAIGGANLDSEKATAFNSKFLAYTGSSVTGANARSLRDLIIANNGTKSTTENPEISNPMQVPARHAAGGGEIYANLRILLQRMRL